MLGTVSVSPFLTRDSSSCPFFSCAGAAVPQSPCSQCSHEEMGHGKHDCYPVLEIAGHSWQWSHCTFSTGIQNVVKFSRWSWKALNVWLNLLGSVPANIVQLLPWGCFMSVSLGFFFCIHLAPHVTWLMIMRSSVCHLEIVGSQSAWWKDRPLQQWMIGHCWILSLVILLPPAQTVVAEAGHQR